MKVSDIILVGCVVGIGAVAFFSDWPEPDIHAESDFYFTKLTQPYKETIIKGVNKIAHGDLRCEYLDPSSATLSKGKGTPDNAVFYVTCGKETADIINIFFTEKDVAAGKLPKVPVHMEKTKAANRCEGFAATKAGAEVLAGLGSRYSHLRSP